MFSKERENQVEVPSAQPTSEKEKTIESTDSAQQKGKGRIAPSIFSADLSIEGSLKSDGDIQFDGRIEGSIRSRSLTIGEKATINGEIVADEVTIRGRVQGSIRARKVHLSSTSHVEGDIFHNALGVESGAFFQGNCAHVDDPLSAEALSDLRATITDKQGKTAQTTDDQKSQGGKDRIAAA